MGQSNFCVGPGGETPQGLLGAEPWVTVEPAGLWGRMKLRRSHLSLSVARLCGGRGPREPPGPEAVPAWGSRWPAVRVWGTSFCREGLRLKWTHMRLACSQGRAATTPAGLQGWGGLTGLEAGPSSPGVLSRSRSTGSVVWRGGACLGGGRARASPPGQLCAQSQWWSRRGEKGFGGAASCLSPARMRTEILGSPVSLLWGVFAERATCFRGACVAVSC